MGGTSAVTYNAGVSYTYGSNVTLYAIWKESKVLATDKITNSPGIISSGGGQRYTGANPNNYVSFNGELWRIIGVFDGKIKIIRNEPIAEKPWNNSIVANDWSSSNLASYLLNYFSSNINITYRQMVENTTWKVGGGDTHNITTAQMYSYEGSTPGKGSTTTTAVNLIGLMSASDYGYASSGCYGGSQTLYDYYNSVCTSTNWLYLGIDEWTLTPSSSVAKDSYYVYKEGGIVSDYGSISRNVRPAVYLKSNVYITGGNGTSSNPYTLSQ